MECVIKNWSTNCLELILVRLDSLDEKHAGVLKEIENKQEVVEDKIKLIERYLKEVDLALDKRNQHDEINKLKERVQIMTLNYSNNYQNFICSVNNNINTYITDNFKVENDMVEYKKDITDLDESYDELLQLIYVIQVQFNNLNANYNNTIEDITKSIRIETRKLRSAFQIYIQMRDVHKNGLRELLNEVKSLVSNLLGEIKTARETNEDFLLNKLEEAMNKFENYK